MSKVQLIGRVFPEVQIVTANITPEYLVTTPMGLELKIVITMKESQVVASCDFEAEATMPVLQDVVMQVTVLSRLTTDLLSFATGLGHFIIFETITFDGKSLKLRFGHEHLANHVSAFSTSSDLRPLVTLFTNEPQAMEALRDITEIMTSPNRSRVNSARAIETIRHLIAGDVKRAEGWPKMRLALNLSDPFLRFISEASVSQRHGDHLWTDKEAQDEVLRRAWIVMNRFIELRIRGVQSLPIDVFPEL